VDLNFSAVTRPVERLMATAQNGFEVLRWGGLETGVVPSPFQTVESTPMYKLRRYFPPDSRPGQPPAGPPVLMVHPMMMSANMWDVTQEDGAVGILHAAGVDPWVIDFGSPDEVEGGMERTLTDHIVALDAAIDAVKDTTGQDVHLAGYSQGGMFCYQTAAYRRSKDIASIIAFGSPVDTLAALPMGIPANVGAVAADFLSDHVFNRVDITGWMARTGFQMLDPLKTAKARIDFVRQLHDREALLPREQQRRFLDSEGWIAWSGPAVAELLKQFIAHNRMMTGGFAINGQLVTLSDITCPVLAFVGEVDDIGQPASVRGIKRAAPSADVYEVMIRAGHFGLVVGSKAATHTWPTVADWVLWLSGRQDRPTSISPMEDSAAEPEESGVAFSSRIMHGVAEASGLAASLVRGAADAVINANKSMRTLAIETARTLPRLTRLGQINDHTRISLGRIIDEQADGAPNGEFLLFDGRVHTYEGVNRRINNVVRGLIHVGVRQGVRVGVLMDTRPSALVAIAALSRLGAVAVLMPPTPISTRRPASSPTSSPNSGRTWWSPTTRTAATATRITSRPTASPRRPCARPPNAGRCRSSTGPCWRSARFAPGWRRSGRRTFRRTGSDPPGRCRSGSPTSRSPRRSTRRNTSGPRLRPCRRTPPRWWSGPPAARSACRTRWCCRCWAPNTTCWWRAGPDRSVNMVGRQTFSPAWNCRATRSWR